VFPAVQRLENDIARRRALPCCAEGLGTLRQHRFPLGRDPAEPLRRYAGIQEQYRDSHRAVTIIAIVKTPRCSAPLSGSSLA
jgi:hypothetical protein